MITPRCLALLAGVVVAACSRTAVEAPDPQPAPVAPASPAQLTERSAVAWLRIPPGYLPRDGECRIWIPDVAPASQRTPRTRGCVSSAREAPAGSWIVYRPTSDRRLIHVRVVHERRPGVVTIVRVYDFDSRRLLREEPYEETQGTAIATGQTESRPPEAPAAAVPPRAAAPAPQSAPAPEQRPLDIAPGNWPDPGNCRVWIPGTSAIRQPHRMSGDCERITANAPAGSWVVYRPATDRLIHVRVVDERRDAVIVVVRVYDEQRRFVREERP